MAPSDAVSGSVATESDASAASSFLWLIILIILLLLMLLFFVVHRHFRKEEEGSPKHRQQISMKSRTTNMHENPMYVMNAVSIGEAIVEEEDGAGNAGTKAYVAYEVADNDPREETQHGGGGEHTYEVCDPAMMSGVAPGVEYDDSQFSQHTGAGSSSSSLGPGTGAVALVMKPNQMYSSGDVGCSSTSSSVAFLAVATADKMCADASSASATDGVNLAVQDGEAGLPVTATVSAVSSNNQYTDVAPSPASQYRDVAPSPSIGAGAIAMELDSMYTDVAPDAETSPLAAGVPRPSNGYVEIEANNEDEVVPEYAAPPNFDAEQVAYNEVTTPWKEGQEMYGVGAGDLPTWAMNGTDSVTHVLVPAEEDFYQTAHEVGPSVQARPDIKGLTRRGSFC